MADRQGPHVIASGAWSAWLDGELSDVEQAQVAAHLAVCPECRAAVEEYRGARWQLRASAPATAPGQAETFWAQLEPRLAPAPRPRPDPALYLAPAALGVAWLLWQGLGLAWSIAGPLGGWQALAAVGQWVSALGLRLAGPSMGPLWLQAALAEVNARLAPLWPLIEAAVSWTVTAAIAGLYIAWVVLWLRRQGPPREYPAP
ncbi:MAG TPA: zf-HC2 domain-containing protein [Anaerolineae bacterium]|nr:zf-HC2 domain-containing protein [Anaerolineae bacterium]HOG47810.1 zf-HC2 domain-containing protein [Anaerolineae bacterium]HOQ98127.1 zf-HC2 domain-containing protein [Anaerolineae bacterium]HPL30842.1 zf-HC2 domain-containing protein [Anaerolineae bacterium]